MADHVFKYKDYDHWKKMHGDTDHGIFTVYKHSDEGGPGCTEVDIDFILGVVMSAFEPEEFARLKLLVAHSDSVGGGGAATGSKSVGDGAQKEEGRGDGGGSSGKTSAEGELAGCAKRQKQMPYVRLGKLKSGDSFPEGSHFDLTSDDDEVADVTVPRIVSAVPAVVSAPVKATTAWMGLSSTEKFAMLVAVREKLAKIGCRIVEVTQVQNRVKAMAHQFWAYNNNAEEADVVRVFHGTSVRSVASIVAQGLMMVKMVNTAFGNGIYSTNDFVTARNYASQRREHESDLQYVLALDLHPGHVHTFGSETRSYEFERLPCGKGYYNTKHIPSKKYYIAKEEAQLYVEAILVVKRVQVVVVETAETREAARLVAEGASDLAAVQQSNRALQHEIRKQQAIAAEAKRVEYRKEQDIAKRKLANERKQGTLLAKQSPIPKELQNLQSFVSRQTTICVGDTVTLVNLPSFYSHLDEALCVVRHIIQEPVALKSRWVIFVEPYDGQYNALILEKNLLNEKKNKGTGYTRYEGENLECFYMTSPSKVTRRDFETRFDCQHNKGSKRRIAAMELLKIGKDARDGAALGGGEGGSAGSGKAPAKSDKDSVSSGESDSDPD